ncbi:hypothetical protein [Streptomyces sp. NBC_01237]|uniref:hypothetical protein n=1 Tax=Streptomyces sp. NBC_01237 TaxID=2903790 RepID=UPI002DDB122C|nr:hypothetical protein [Streptomyces sp. NBC_01237]WRZ73891.1 hypothetical protein OG251_20910 [Streptomyces sp. NBC_01237]
MRSRTLLVVAAAIGALAVQATPASAAQNWQAVDTNSNWYCSDYFKHSVSDYVKYKTCIVLNSNYDAQAVLVVQSTASVAVSIGGSLKESNFSSNVSCANTTLNPGFTRGCFAPTIGVGSSGDLKATGELKLNGVSNSKTFTLLRVSR